MRICVTDRPDLSAPDLRPAGELAPSLALPWIGKLRYGVLFGQAALILLACLIFHIKLPLLWLALPLAITATSNLLVKQFSMRFGARRTLGLFLTLDTLCLTAVLALSGGPANPFTLLYLVQITLSAVVLSKPWTWALGILSVMGFGFLFWIHVRIPALEAHHVTQGFSIHLFGMWIAFAAATLMVTVFIGRVSEALRTREQEVLLLQDRLARHQLFASIARLAAGAAHELGTPLATIAVASRELERYAREVSGDVGVSEDAWLIRCEVERCGHILRQMSGSGAELTGESPVPVELNKIVEGVKDGLTEAEAQLIQSQVVQDGKVLLPVNATRQALMALVKNSLDSSPPGQVVSLSAECASGRICFVVRDSGTGMSQEVLTRVSEPFFTTKGSGRHLGLGTFLVRLFAESLEGSLVFESESGVGTTAILELPLINYDGKRETGNVDR